MKKIIRVLVFGLLAVNLVACGSTGDQSTSEDNSAAKEHAQALIKEQNSLATSLSLSSTPNSSWTDGSLSALEAKVNRLEQVENELRSLNGKNGVVIRGGGSAYLISSLRGSISDARTEKIQRASAAQAAEMYDQLLSQRNELVSEILDEHSKINELLKLSDSAEIKAASIALIPKVDAAISIAGQQQELIIKRKQDLKDADSLEQEVKTFLVEMDSEKASLNSLAETELPPTVSN